MCLLASVARKPASALQLPLSLSLSWKHPTDTMETLWPFAQVIDVWPERVLRFAQQAGSDEAVALQGAPDGVGPLVPVSGRSDGGGGEAALGATKDGARTVYGIMARALEELRSFVDGPPAYESQGEAEGDPDGDHKDRTAHQQQGQAHKGEAEGEGEGEMGGEADGGGRGRGKPQGEEENGHGHGQKNGVEKVEQQEEGGEGNAAGDPGRSSRVSDLSDSRLQVADTEGGRQDPMDVAATSNGNGAMHDDRLTDEAGRRGDRDRADRDRGGSGQGVRERQGRVDSEEMVYAGRTAGGPLRAPGVRGSPIKKRPRNEQGFPNLHPGLVGGNRLPEGSMVIRRDHVDRSGAGDREREREVVGYREEADVDDGEGAGEMTVVAVRTSLLRNRADEGPNPDDGEWEAMVREFIQYVEGLSPGTAQEELSLMFAAALDPTLVRMRAANELLVRLAEECAMPEADLDDEEDEDDDDGDYGAGGGRGNGTSNGIGFKVRLELDATADGEDPPPEGIEYLLKTVGAARAALIAAARARACMAAAGDTLGGLHELKADYKRSLPPGPREPIQSIIAEEQARVRGYATAHEEIANRRVHQLRLRGKEVGEAYRAVEGEPGWSGVRRQVDAFLRRFAAYCGAQLPGEGSEPGLFGLDIAVPKSAEGWH